MVRVKREGEEGGQVGNHYIHRHHDLVVDAVKLHEEAAHVELQHVGKARVAVL